MNPGEFSRLNRVQALGLLHEISDSVLLAVMERQYILKQEVRRERHIKSLFQIQSRHLLDRQGLIEGWVVSMGPRWKTVRKLDSRTHTKPSSLRVPLSPLSSHPKWVHNWWPLGEIRRFAKRSTQHKKFIKTRDRFIERLEKYNDDETVINKCKTLEFTKRPGVDFKE